MEFRQQRFDLNQHRWNNQQSSTRIFIRAKVAEWNYLDLDAFAWSSFARGA
jgi:hypothetical protein